MIQKLLLAPALLICTQLTVKAQPAAVPASNDLYFVSDTQQPMFVEKLWLKPNHNLAATAGIFSAVLKEKPRSLYMLGDVVGLGSSNHKWKKVDAFLETCRNNGTTVCGILGNHEVMGRAKKGEANFQKRFPMNVSTGYISVTDSVAVVLLNSNFSKLSEAENNLQKEWYEKTMASLDTTAAVKAVIVCCHHAPFTNSKIVKCNNKVQDNFVAAYVKSKKAQLFITGHAHAFEHFKMQGKDFLVIGGGGGLHQPLNQKANCLPDLATGYKPPFHYLSVKRTGDKLSITSHAIGEDFASFNSAYNFSTNHPEADNMASTGSLTTEALKKN